MSKNEFGGLEELQRTIKRLHKCKAFYFETVVVVEKFGLETVWQGPVHSFQIEGHPRARLCFAWASPIKDSTKIRQYTVLCVPPIDSPEKAVRASIVQGARANPK